MNPVWWIRHNTNRKPEPVAASAIALSKEQNAASLTNAHILHLAVFLKYELVVKFQLWGNFTRQNVRDPRSQPINSNLVITISWMMLNCVHVSSQS